MMLFDAPLTARPSHSCRVFAECPIVESHPVQPLSLKGFPGSCSGQRRHRAAEGSAYWVAVTEGARGHVHGVDENRGALLVPKVHEYPDVGWCTRTVQRIGRVHVGLGPVTSSETTVLSWKPAVASGSPTHPVV